MKELSLRYCHVGILEVVNLSRYVPHKNLKTTKHLKKMENTYFSELTQSS